MNSKILGVILIAAGVALLLFARGQITKIVKAQDTQEIDGQAREATRFIPQIAILLGGFAIVAGFLLLA